MTYILYQLLKECDEEKKEHPYSFCLFLLSFRKGGRISVFLSFLPFPLLLSVARILLFSLKKEKKKKDSAAFLLFILYLSGNSS